MKRTWILLTLLCCLFFAPSISSANSVKLTTVQMENELPWYIVQAVLHEVDEVTSYSYDDLLQLYSDSLIDITDLGGGYYRCKIHDASEQDVIVNI
jgi:hypothetical protein